MLWLLILLMLGPGTPQGIEVRSGEILNVVVAGEGPAVVLMPGLAGCAYGYRKVTGPLQDQGLKTVIIEPLGYGASSRPEGVDYSLTAQADRVAAACDALGLKNCVVVGHGISASIAMRLAYRRPDLVAGVISIEGAAEESAATPGVKSGLKIAGLVLKLGGQRILRDRFTRSLDNVSGDTTWIDRRTLGRYLKNVDRDMGAYIAAVRAMAEAVEPESLRENLDRIACPVRVMIGTADHAASLAQQDLETLQAGIADFAVMPVEGSGHYVFEEQPAAVIREVASLASTVLSPPGTSANNDRIHGTEREAMLCAQ